MDGESVITRPMLGLGLVIPIPTASADHPIADRHTYTTETKKIFEYHWRNSYI